MYDAETPPLNAADLDAVEAMVSRATDALLRAQKPDGHWVFELEADATIPAEYVLLRHYLGEPENLDLESRIGRYLRRIQALETHGGWALFHAGAFDISATVKAYFALKMIGDDVDAPHMVRAREAVLAHGGAAASNVFTRIQLALYGAGSWKAIPTMPVELILLPRWFPIHLSKMSYWARTVIVPLLVLQVLKPVAKNPRGVRVDELYLPKATVKPQSKAADTKLLWTIGFNALDVVLKAVDPFWPKRLRKRAFDRRGRSRRNLSRHGQQRDDVRRPRLCGGSPGSGHRPQVGGEAPGLSRGRGGLLPALRLAGVGHSPNRPRDAGGRR
jgi:squalene-hopene/tetraprenyl-beta-curcumene cyclase